MKRLTKIAEVLMLGNLPVLILSLILAMFTQELIALKVFIGSVIVYLVLFAYLFDKKPELR